MDARLQRRIQRYGWDKAADTYEVGWKDVLIDARKWLLRMADARSGEEVLDIAFGTGLVGIPLAETVGPPGRVVATDISERMVSGLRRSDDTMRLAQMEVFRADTEALDANQDNSLDPMTCALGLMYVPGTLKARAEVRRVLSPGGRAVFAVGGARAMCDWAYIFPIVDARVKSEVCPLFFRLGTGDRLAREMDMAGFVRVDRWRLSALPPYADDQAAIAAAFCWRPCGAGL